MNKPVNFTVVHAEFDMTLTCNFMCYKQASKLFSTLHRRRSPRRAASHPINKWVIFTVVHADVDLTLAYNFMHYQQASKLSSTSCR